MLPKVVAEISTTALQDASSEATVVQMKRLRREYLEIGRDKY